MAIIAASCRAGVSGYRDGAARSAARYQAAVAGAPGGRRDPRQRNESGQVPPKRYFRRPPSGMTLGALRAEGRERMILSEEEDGQALGVGRWAGHGRHRQPGAQAANLFVALRAL